MKQDRVKRCISVMLVWVMLAGCVVGLAPTMASAKGKQVASAKLKTRSMSLKVGQKKKIKLSGKKKTAKYLFKSSKSKVAKVSKKGLVTAKRSGTTKITVREKRSGKVRKLGVVKVKVKKRALATEQQENAQVAAPTAASTAVPGISTPQQATPQPTTAQPQNGTPSPTDSSGSGVAPTEEPVQYKVTPTQEELAAAQWEAIDLSLYNAYNVQNNCSYDSTTSSLTAVDQEFVGFPLGQDLIEGQTVLVKVKGVNRGAAGFRSWLVTGASQSTTCCDEKEGLLLFKEGGNTDFTVGEFEIAYKLTATSDCNYLFFKGPSYQTNIEDLTISSIQVSYFEKTETKKFEPTQEQSEKMVQDSLLSSGNNARIKSVLAKARNGEDVTMAYIGGSVTEGAGASPNANCYAERSYTEFAKAYGTGDNVHFINAGMSGTPSSLGVVRYERDILGQMSKGENPDILFIEFAVNDFGECTSGGAYEGLIRRALASGSAVVLLYSVFLNHWNMQDTYIPYGEHYQLPMISMKTATDSFYQIEGFNKWYFSDDLHPSNQGYELTSDCITNLFETIDKQAAQSDNIVDVSTMLPYKTDAFAATTMLEPTCVEVLLQDAGSSLSSFEAGGFDQTDSATGTYLFDSTKQKFAANWMHTASSSTDSLKAEVTCKNLLVVYKLSSNANTGSAELYVDGVKKCTLNGYDTSGWNNATTELAFQDTTAQKHTIEIRMADGDENKEFTLLAMGYNQ